MYNRVFYYGVQSCYKCENRKVGCHAICDKYLSECGRKNEKVNKHRKARMDSLRSIGKITKGTRLDNLYLQT